jgi:hypothetical protein
MTENLVLFDFPRQQMNHVFVMLQFSQNSYVILQFF